MKQLRMYGVNELRLDEVPVPAPGPDDIVVKIIAAGICGSDLGFLRDGYIGRPSGEPVPLGHELVGVIHALGENVASLEVGQRVVIHPMKGRNRIGTGDPAHGGFAEYLLVRDARSGESVFPIQDNLSLERAVLTEPIAVSMHGLNKADVQASDRVVILGAGPIGLGAIAALKHRGVKEIVVVDVIEERLERALQLGASATVNTGRQALRDGLEASFGTVKSKVMRQPSVNASLYIDCAGHAPLLDEIFSMACDGARLLILATHKKPMSIDLAQLIIKEISVIGSLSYPTEFAEVLDMLGNQNLVIEPMISHSYPLDDYEAAFQTAQAPHLSAKVILRLD
ncbi:MAG TPA: alcohol dehydrogenase [Pseudomonas xinjiangensis]|uniref:Alcohol dehydrogenase n=2 Tax=root TaxID=1 RepID=A0A7V1BL39_9GAMM|nr:alcohol dehydrogenase [Halopseudomonas xinjiangensis]HEC47568.1 alcohol dehydrogenase [Halopseudomonas xinjiangensis]